MSHEKYKRIIWIKERSVYLLSSYIQFYTTSARINLRIFSHLHIAEANIFAYFKKKKFLHTRNWIPPKNIYERERLDGNISLKVIC